MNLGDRMYPACKKWAKGWLVAVVPWIPGCGPAEPETPSPSAETATHREALSGPGLTPVPCLNDTPSWDGNRVQLLVADAWAACLSGPNTEADLRSAIARESKHADEYMGQVIRHMESAYGASDPVASEPLLEWKDARATSTKNCDPSSGAPMGWDIESADITVPALLTDLQLSDSGAKAAQYELAGPSIDLCVAQQLRRAAPGAMGAEAVLFSAAEQLELLEVIRERAQIAMLRFAQLGSVFTAGTMSGTLQDLLPDNDGLYLKYILRWSEGNDPVAQGDDPPALAAMGRDFAAAVQLHIATTRELAELMARSRSAGSASTAKTPAARSDRLWGTESWQQRMLALMYGGDPLAINGEAPWKHSLNRGGPLKDQMYGLYPGILEMTSMASLTDLDISGYVFASPTPLFPGRADFGYISEEISAPEVWKVLQLLRENDLLRIDVTGTGSCRVIDSVATSSNWSTDLEDALWGRFCSDYVANGPEDAGDTECARAQGAGPEGTDTLLFQRYHISKEHITKLAGFVRDALGAVVTTSWTDACPFAQRQPFDVIGTVTLSGTKLLLSKDAEFVPISLAERASAFSRIESFAMPLPSHIDVSTYAGTQGFHSIPWFYDSQWPEPASALNPDELLASSSATRSIAERKRRMGAIAALQATRDLTLFSLTTARGASDARARRVQDFFALGDDLLSTITSAVGGEGVTIRPRLKTVPGPVLYGAQLASYRHRDGARWIPSVTAKADDPFWSIGPNEGITIFFAPKGQWSANVVRAGELGRKSGSILTRNLGSMMGNAKVAGTFAPMAVLTSSEVNPALRYFWPTDDPADVTLGDAEHWTVFAAKGPLTALAEAAPSALLLKFKLIDADFRALPDHTEQYRVPGLEQKALYLATGGELGDLVKRQVETSPLNPVLPAYDGFGLSQDWVPPFTAELLGGEVGQSSVPFLMDRAKSTAEDARNAVATAFDNMLDRQAGEADLAAAEQRSEQQLQQAVQGLCGSSQAGCDPQIVPSTLDEAWYPSLAGRPNVSGFATPCATRLTQLDQLNDSNGDAAKEAVDCITDRRINQLLSTSVGVAAPVSAKLLEQVSSVPAFEEYAGGKLQSLYIEQFRALKAPDEWLATMISEAKAVKQRIVIAQKVIREANHAVKRKCGTAATVLAVFDTAGTAAQGAALGSFGGPAGAVAGAVVGGLSAWSAHTDACKAAKKSLGTAKAQAVGAMLDGFASMVAASQGLTNMEAAAQQSSAAIEQATLEAAQATSRAELEAKLAAYGQRTSYGLYRQYTEYDLWRAKALLENARRFALTARRAVEAKYVVDLSRMTDGEPFVAAPSTWADEIYQYDLSMPAAVGLSVGQTSGGGIYPNKIVDYVGNLESFMAGYTVKRPTAVSQADIDVIWLPGTSAGAVAQEQFAEDAPGTPTSFYPDQGNWAVSCDGFSWAAPEEAQLGGAAAACTVWQSAPCSTACVHGDIECAIANDCYVAPVSARLGFSMDPWGRVNGSATSPPYVRRYNARWGQLAVNLIGSGVIDCSRAADPLVCYSQSYVRFDLGHVGATIVTDYTEQWRTMNAPFGRIEGGKALAAEFVLDPLRDGWSTSYIAPVARTEFSERPLGGDYVLELAAGPSVRLDHLDRVQILVGQSYWVVEQ